MTPLSGKMVFALQLLRAVHIAVLKPTLSN
jgi:predicted P-loop ATPase/GTPase